VVSISRELRLSSITTCLANLHSTCIEWVGRPEQGEKAGAIWVTPEPHEIADHTLARSVTLVGEADRKILKAAIKHGTGADQVRHRVVPPDFVAKWASKLAELKDEVSAVLQQEQEEKHVRFLPFLMPCYVLTIA
jgi:hypothetical protein